MSKMGKWVLALVVLAVLAAVALMLIQNKNEAPASAPAEESFNPENPNFILGELVAINESTLEVRSGTETYTVMVGTDTKLSKQAKVEGVLTSVDAQLSDFKPKSTVVVYYSEGSGVEKVSAKATPIKIQIISQE